MTVTVTAWCTRINVYYKYHISVLALLLFTGFLTGQTVPDAKVRYLSASHIYLDIGSTAGLTTGDRLKIIRKNETIAEIEVTYTASASSSCKIISSTQEIRIGDIARWIGHTQETVQKDTISERRIRSVPERTVKRKLPAVRPRVNGSFSFQWYHFNDVSATAMDFDQLNARLNLRIRDIWIKDFSLNINSRARFNQRKSAIGQTLLKEEWRNRIYWISFSYDRSDAPFNFQLGRIASNKFSGLGYLDGLILQHNVTISFRWGVFAGVQPDMRAVDLSTEMKKYGIYGLLQLGNYSATLFKTTLALAGSYVSGKINREYAYFELRISDASGWNINQSMEIDYNRQWRKEYSDKQVNLTGFYLSGSYKFSEWLTTGISYDNRKNYLTYIYYSQAQKIFDESQRHALRSDVRIYLPEATTVSIKLGARKGQHDSNMSYSYGINIAKSDLIVRQLQLNLGFSGFNTIYNQGINPSASIRYQWGAIGSGTTFGFYRYMLDGTDNQRINRWVNLYLSLPLWSHIYLFSQFNYDWGDDTKGTQILAEIAYRF